jgi:hypothetical protein
MNVTVNTRPPDPAGSSHWHLLEADFEVALAELRVVGKGLIDKQLLIHMHLGEARLERA